MHPIHSLYQQHKTAIRQRLFLFSQITREEDIFYELCFCLLTPQTKGKQCWERVEILRKHNFKGKSLNPHSFIKDIRFHNNKNTYLLAAKQQFSLVLEQLKKTTDARALREWLVTHIKGYGYKGASHFLRNIGYRNLAILDHHILRNLQRYKIVRTLPKTLTKKKYLALEQKFLIFSDKIGIPMDELDLLFWSQETGEIFK
jgi:N-glycosylase/DNA lyase